MIREYDAYELALLAECAEPETQHSPGANMLLQVQADAADAHVKGYGPPVPTASVNEHAGFAQFTDLWAYREDISDYGPIVDMLAGAKCSLYVIAGRLTDILFAEWDKERGR